MKKRKLKRKIKKYHWIIILAFTVVLAMYIYGMTAHYFPEPLSLGAGQYFDIGKGITIVGLLLAGVILTKIKIKKKRK